MSEKSLSAKLPDLARTGYNAYCNSTGGRSLVTGAPLPAFDELSDEIKLAWTASACAVALVTVEHTQRNVMASMRFD